MAIIPSIFELLPLHVYGQEMTHIIPAENGIVTAWRLHKMDGETWEVYVADADENNQPIGTNKWIGVWVKTHKEWVWQQVSLQYVEHVAEHPGLLQLLIKRMILPIL